MFKQVFRLTFVTFIWKQYKRIIVSTVLLFAFLWFVGFAHSEYLDYATRENVDNVGVSFFIKWIALILGVAIYFLYHYLMPSRKDLKKKKSKDAIEIKAPADGEPDPFDQFRNKEKLRTRAEILIDREKSE
ncbi:MAG: hypothetical protein KTR16_01395 [Acidiferrobacterales bacterium]|nr:hypothetical protein [Acidiferrobacterales bacterium]